MQKRKLGSEGIQGMEDSFAGENISSMISTACHQSWEEDGEQGPQEETKSKAETKGFGARKRGSARTRSLSGQIGSCGIEKRDKWNYWENNKCQLLQGVLKTEGDKKQRKCNRKKKKKSTCCARELSLRADDLPLSPASCAALASSAYAN